MRKTVFSVVLILAMSTCALAQAGKKADAKPAKSTEQALKDIETKWAAASLKSDADAMAAVVTDDWTAITPEGKTQTKAEAVEMTKKAKLTKSSSTDMKVRMLGKDAAVVTGTWTGAGTDADGKKFETTERYTDVFAKKNGEWKAVSSQSTTVKK